MSWYGSHPKISIAEARALLPPGACKRCIYWMRVMVGQELRPTRCPRCNLKIDVSAAKEKAPA
jgi:predicted Zn-ribbon and HTH transcriptional regulator